MDEGAPLNVLLIEERVEIEIKTAFVPIVPDHDGWVVDILFDHLLYKFAADLRIIGMLSAGELVEHEKPQGIADIEEMVVGGIVGHADGIHVHVLHQLDVFDTKGFA
jgi:hypothetical protein